MAKNLTLGGPAFSLSPGTVQPSRAKQLYWPILSRRRHKPLRVSLAGVYLNACYFAWFSGQHFSQGSSSPVTGQMNAPSFSDWLVAPFSGQHQLHDSRSPVMGQMKPPACEWA